MNQAAYQTRGMRSEPMATVSVEGTMRGVQLGTMTIEPVSYDPVSYGCLPDLHHLQERSQLAGIPQNLPSSRPFQDLSCSL